MVKLINKDMLKRTSTGWKFEGFNFSNSGVSFFIIEAEPGKGAKLHHHPYEEVFIHLEGKAIYTIGDEIIEVEGNEGKIIIAPANVPHKFVNTGTTILKQIDIHPVEKMVQFDLE